MHVTVYRMGLLVINEMTFSSPVIKVVNNGTFEYIISQTAQHPNKLSIKPFCRQDSAKLQLGLEFRILI